MYGVSTLSVLKMFVSIPYIPTTFISPMHLGMKILFTFRVALDVHMEIDTPGEGIIHKSMIYLEYW